MASAPDTLAGYALNAPPAAAREKDDFYSTPPEAVRALLAIEQFAGRVWEPACGDGAISRVLESAGLEVVSSDLVDRGFGLPRVDFLLEPRLLAPTIITNPPFKLAEQFLEKALDLGAQKVALLLRLSWLEGGKRKLIFERTPLARVLVASRRLAMGRGGNDFGGGGGGIIAFAWFVWDCEHAGAPSLGWFDWQDYAAPLTREPS